MTTKVLVFYRRSYKIRLHMKLYPLVLASVLLLSSCSLLEKGEYVPEYLKEPSPLDPPGTEAARAAEKAKRVKEGAFETGSTQKVNEGKVFLFKRNPDYDEDVSGKMVNTENAKIISCEGLYYFVQVDDGSKGFLRESDMQSPVTHLVSTSEMSVPGADFTAPADAMFPEPGEVIELEYNQKLMTNSVGRTVVVSKKQSDKSSAFEARKKALLEGKSLDSVPLPDPADVPLPEPSGSAGE